MERISDLVLVVDDDSNICEALRIYLEAEGMEVAAVHNGNLALTALRNLKPQLVLLDVTLPGMSGWDILKEIRSNSILPVIMLSARGEPYDKVHGLNLGADDYVVKPFEPQELLARVRAVLRRTKTPAILNQGDLAIDMGKFLATVAGVPVELTPRELELLHYLATRPEHVFTRQQLLDSVWGYDYSRDTRTVDVHIKRLRAKLNCPRAEWDIRTVWSVGYKFSILRSQEP